MNQVNFLPWRADVLRQRWRQIYCLTLIYTLLVIILLWSKFLQLETTYQTQVIQYQIQQADYQQKVALLEQYQIVQKQIEQQQIIIERVAQLRARTNSILHFFSYIETVLPHQVWLTDISVQQQQLIVKGDGFNQQQIVVFSQQLAELPFLQHPSLNRINKNKSATQQLARLSYVYQAKWLGGS